MFVRLAVATALVASTHAADLVWNAKSVDLNTPGNIVDSTGAIVEPSAVGTLTFGTIETRATGEMQLGKKIVFGGKTKIVLGTGTGKTKLTLGGSGTKDANFVPGSSAPMTGNGKGGVFDFQCHRNWRVNGNMFKLPTNEGGLAGPCGGDTVWFYTTKARFDPADPTTWTVTEKAGGRKLFVGEDAGASYEMLKIMLDGKKVTCEESGLFPDCSKVKTEVETPSPTCASTCSPHATIQDPVTQNEEYLVQLEDGMGKKVDYLVGSDGMLEKNSAGTGVKYAVSIETVAQLTSGTKCMNPKSFTVTDLDAGKPLPFDPAEFCDGKNSVVKYATEMPSEQPTPAPSVADATPTPVASPTVAMTTPAATPPPASSPTTQSADNADKAAEMAAKNLQDASKSLVEGDATAVTEYVNALDAFKDAAANAATEKGLQAYGNCEQDDASCNKAVTDAIRAQQIAKDKFEKAVKAVKDVSNADPSSKEFLDKVRTAQAAKIAYDKANNDVISSPRASTGSDDSGDDSDNTVIIAVVVVVVVLIIAVGVVVVMLKGKNSSGGERAVVSFENPMYDQAGKPAPPAGGAGGLYAEPAAVETGATGATGYMDVGGGAPAASSGYMDVAPNANGNSGYMDVAGAAEDDYDDDGEEDV